MTAPTTDCDRNAADDCRDPRAREEALECKQDLFNVLDLFHDERMHITVFLENSHIQSPFPESKRRRHYF